MYTFEYFVGHDYHVLNKETMTITFSKNFGKWIESIEYNDKSKTSYVTIYENDDDAYESYRESMQSYGFRPFKLNSGHY